jgi:hypothetical protein
LSYYIHCYVFQLVCQYDDIPLVLIYCKRTFFPMCRMSGNVNTLVYFDLAICTSVFNQTIPKQKRSFLGLKVHFLTQNMRPFPYVFVMLLSWSFRDINKLFIDVLRGIQGLWEQWVFRSSSVHTRIQSYFSCLTTFTVMYFNWFVNMTTYHSNWILRLDIFVAALINYRSQFTIKTKGLPRPYNL